jgi:hypothetical protein
MAPTTNMLSRIRTKAVMIRWRIIGLCYLKRGRMTNVEEG